MLEAKTYVHVQITIIFIFFCLGYFTIFIYINLLYSQQYWDLKREWWDSAEVQAGENFREQKTRIGLYILNLFFFLNIIFFF